MLACKFVSLFALRLTCKVLCVLCPYFCESEPLPRNVMILHCCAPQNAIRVYVNYLINHGLIFEVINK